MIKFTVKVYKIGLNVFASKITLSNDGNVGN